MRYNSLFPYESEIQSMNPLKIPYRAYRARGYPWNFGIRAFSQKKTSEISGTEKKKLYTQLWTLLSKGMESLDLMMLIGGARLRSIASRIQRTPRILVQHLVLESGL